MTSGIYLITNQINGKVYVGQSINVFHRLSRHKSQLKFKRHYNEHLQDAWNKYGAEAFTFELWESTSEDHLTAREAFWINAFSSGERKNGYNLKRPDVNEPKFRHSEETKRKMGNARRGRKHSDETRQRIALGNKGKTSNLGHKNSQATKDKRALSCSRSFSLISPDGEKFQGINISAFARENSLNVGALCYVVSGKAAQHKGWRKA